MRQMLFLFLMVVGFANSVPAQTASETSGKAVFDKWCTACPRSRGAQECHVWQWRFQPGTSALAVKYKGKLPAVLEERTDLTSAQIKTVVRHGLYGMPITRKTEVSDAELEDVVAYLTRNRKK